MGVLIAYILLMLMIPHFVVVSTILIILLAIAVFFISIKLKFVFYIMNDETDLSAVNYIKKSWRITKGSFGKILLFELSFIGWRLLTLLTFGALNLYVLPYRNTAVANFYLSLTQTDEPNNEQL